MSTCPFMKKIKSRNGLILNTTCGKCEVCLDNKRRDYTVRLNDAYNNYRCSYFITLTFNEELYKDDRDYCIDCYQKYMKILRKKELYKKKVKYFAVLERGDFNHRFHWHQLLFTDEIQPQEYVRQDIIDAWRYGIVDIGVTSSGGISYLTKYLYKQDYKMLISRGLGWENVSEQDVLQVVDGKRIIDGFTYRIPQSTIAKLRRSERRLYDLYIQPEREKKIEEYMRKQELKSEKELLDDYNRLLRNKIAKTLRFVSKK